MPLFLTDEEFRSVENDAAAVAERADSVITDLRHQLETVRAEADAAAIAAEQTCAILEQRYVTVSADVARLQAENSQLSSSLQQQTSEIASKYADKQQSQIATIEKDAEIERLRVEVAELHKSKRQLLELVELKDAEIGEKNATIQSYYDRIVKLIEDANSKEARIRDLEAEVTRFSAMCNRLTEEKELIEKHNHWLNEELTAKVNSLIDFRKTQMEVEASLVSQKRDLENELKKYSSLYAQSKDRILELEDKVSSREEELLSCKDASAANNERFAVELSTVSKLADLYKASSEEWSKKAGDLEGVIKALEMHLTQVENDYKSKLEIEVSSRHELEKESLDLKEKLRNCEADLEKARKTNEFSILPASSLQSLVNPEELFVDEGGINYTSENNDMIVPKVPSVSGTAFAASLLRDGWSLVKIHDKYQEAANALIHEKWERRRSEAVLQRVLHEIEEKAELILAEREEHERMTEAYDLMSDKLQQALLEHEHFESVIRGLKSDLKRQERDNKTAEKVIDDLQKQVVFLLKECQDIQIRCGYKGIGDPGVPFQTVAADNSDGSSTDAIISDRLLTFKDINGLVEQNVQLRNLVRRLSDQDEKKEAEIKEKFQLELQKITDEAAAKVELLLKRSEEQGRMVESLHSSVAMYKKLYEEERKNHASNRSYSDSQVLAGEGNYELVCQTQGSEELLRKAYNEVSERAKNLEDELNKLRNELASSRMESDRKTLEASFARDKLDSFMKSVELERQERNSMAVKNEELQEKLVSCQKMLRESYEAARASEDKARQLAIEVSVLKREIEIVENSERRATDEVRSLTEKVGALQLRLDTILSTEDVRQSARSDERRHLEESLKRVEREWTEARKELQEERDRVRALILDRQRDSESSLKQLEEMRKELAEAWHTVASSESKAVAAEARCSQLEMKIKLFGKKVSVDDVDGQTINSDEKIEEILKAKQEIEKLKEESAAYKESMLQYQKIAHTSEAVLKQMESAHEEHMTEAEKLKATLEANISSLKCKISELEKNYALRLEEASSIIECKEKEISTAKSEAAGFREELAEKMRQIEALEKQVSLLKDSVSVEHNRWQSAHNNYQRQVTLQSETIQELTITSRRLADAQVEVSKLREHSETLKSDMEMLKVSFEKEKSTLLESKAKAESMYKEASEQNESLLNQLEVLLKERSTVGRTSHFGGSPEDRDLSNFLGLRRDKEIVQKEKSLLEQRNARIEQENVLLKRERDIARKHLEEIQALLLSQTESAASENVKYKSEQLDVNRLRGYIAQLRQENKHNFEESQKYREESLKSSMEVERLNKLLREKQIEIDACQKSADIKENEIGLLKKKIDELVESCKKVDAVEYGRMKEEVQVLKERLNETEVQLQQTKNLSSQMQDLNAKLEQELFKCQAELSEREKKLNDIIEANASSKQENDRQKKALTMLKRKNETLIKEKEELSKEIQSLQKQIDDLKSKLVSESSDDAAKGRDKEYETRIQMLERILEKERDEKQKEKAYRKKTEKELIDILQNVTQERKKVENELEKHRAVLADALQKNQISGSSAVTSKALEEQTSAYIQLVDSFQDAAGSALRKLGSQADATILEPSIPSAGPGGQAPVQRPAVGSDIRGPDDRVKGSTSAKPILERKAARRLVRPRLEGPEEPTAEADMPSITESAITAEEVKVGPSSQEHDVPADASPLNQPLSSRKRAASSPDLDMKSAVTAQDEDSTDTAPPNKRHRDTESAREGGDGQGVPTSPDIISGDLGAPTKEQLESDPAVTLTAEDDEPEVFTKEESEDLNQEDEMQNEPDTAAEESLDDPKGRTTESVDKLRTDEGDTLQAAVEGEDAREEGELMPDESDQQEEASFLGEGRNELVGNDTPMIAEEAGELLEDTAVDVINEKSIKLVEIQEEAVEGYDNTGTNNNSDNTSMEPEKSSQISFAANEASTSTSTITSTPAAVTEHPSPSKTIESEEHRTGRTITLSVRARENAQKREEARRAIQLARGRGRPFRRARGGRS